MRERLTIALLFFTIFASGTETLIMNPVLPQIAGSLGIDTALAARSVTSYAIAAGVFAFLFGPLGRRVDRKYIIVLGLLLLGVATALCGSAAHLDGLVLARAASGAGAGILVTATTSYVADRFEGERRAVVMGVVVSAFFLALLVGVFLGALIAGSIGWREMFHALGGAISVLAVATFAGLPLARSNVGPRAGPFFATAAADYGAVLRSRAAWAVTLGTACNMIGMAAFSVYLSPWLVEQYHFDTLERGLAYAVGAPAALIASPLAGRLAAKRGAVPIIVIANAVVLTVMLLVSFAPRLAYLFPTYPWIPLVVLLFISLAGSAARSSVLETLAVEAVGAELRGSLAAVRTLFMHSGSALGAAVGAVIWAATEHSLFAECVLAAAATALGAGVLVVLSREKR